MTPQISPMQMLKAHVQVQLGTYFQQDTCLAHGVRYASSARIDDAYWNYAYGLDRELAGLPSSIQAIRDHAVAIDRPPALYILPDTRPSALPGILQPRSAEAEAWMVVDHECLRGDVVVPKLKIEQFSMDESDDFLHVFRCAYGGSDPDAPGYSDLPEAYPLSLKHASPSEGVTIVHLLGTDDVGPACIASVYCGEGLAGLYNVGTAPRAQGRGYGACISIQAAKIAFGMGCGTVFLQTEPSSPVERLYSRIGFSRAFVGLTLLL